MTTARDLMTVDPVSILETDTLVVAARTMRDRAVFSLPVCAEGHRLTGVITDRDIVVGCVADGADPGDDDRRAARRRRPGGGRRRTTASRRRCS